MKKIILIVGGVVLIAVLYRTYFQSRALEEAFWVEQGEVKGGDIKVDVGNNTENNSVRTPPALP